MYGSGACDSLRRARSRGRAWAVVAIGDEGRHRTASPSRRVSGARRQTGQGPRGAGSGVISMRRLAA